jgi:thiol-disulfide isomerase/thioredoxin
MDLQELFNTAVADLPDLPDQVPAAQRIHRRRTAVVRSSAIAAACALVVGVGTLTFASPWSHHPADKTVSAAGTPMPLIPRGATDFPPDKRTAAPALSGTTLTGTPYSTSYAGHVTVIEAWGSWCTPCREQAPDLAKAYTQFESEGVDFVGIDVRDDNAAALVYDTQFGIEYPSLQDPQEAVVLALKQIIPTDSLPLTVIVDSNGKVAATIRGAVTTAGLDDEIDYALTTASP